MSATTTHDGARADRDDDASPQRPGVGAPSAQHGGEPPALTGDQKRTLALLGLPTLGLALSITVVSTYLPVLAREMSSSTTVIGVLISAEGLLALFLPLVVGAWSDRLRTRWGGRLPFVLAGTPVAMGALFVMGFLHSLFAIALVVALFFAAYFVAYEPYRALYPDLIADRAAGRAQSTQGLWRGVGTGVAIVAGGLLFGAAHPAPFVAAGVVLGVAVAVFAYALVRSGRAEAAAQGLERREERSLRETASSVLDMLRQHRPLRLFLAANGLWELSLAALKTFVVLYITRGLGHTTSFASGAIGGAAVFILLGTVVSGRLADRMGASRVMEASLWLYGLALMVPFALSSFPIAVIAAAPFAAFGGGVLMTLPFALLQPLMPIDEHGTVTGYYSLSRGVGVMLGPVIAGGAIQLLEPVLSSTQGYAAMWGVVGVASLVSIPLLRRLRSAAYADPDLDIDPERGDGDGDGDAARRS